MVGAYTILNIVFLSIWQYQAHKLIGIRLIDTIKDVIFFLFVSLGIMIVVYFTTSFIRNLIILLVVRIILAVILYILIMKICKVKIFQESLEYF